MCQCVACVCELERVCCAIVCVLNRAEREALINSFTGCQNKSNVISMLAALTQFLCSIFAARIQLIDNFIFSVSGLIQKTLMDFFLFSKNFSGQEKKLFLLVN